MLLHLLTAGFGTKLPFAAFETSSAFWGTAVEKCSLWGFRILTQLRHWPPKLLWCTTREEQAAGAKVAAAAE